MGNESSKLEETDVAEQTSEYLDDHPTFLSEYIDRNPHLLDNYVVENVDEATVRAWLKKVQGPAPAEVLQTLRIDYLKEKNCSEHHTDKYIHNSLVVRRAARFSLDIYFKNRAYLPAKDNILLEFSIGNKPQVSNGTKFRIPIKDSLQASQWTGMLIQKDDQAKKVEIQVNVPATAIIGRYKLTVEVTSHLAEGLTMERKAKPDVVVIFNPFQPNDDVYMENEEHRNEYVLNDTGIVYFGQYYRIGGKKWLFGQFEEGILDIALKLLREDSRAKKNAQKSLKQRASPGYCSRVLSAMVNCNDDDGVLYGRWDGDYADGVRPTTWNGSVKILKQWNEQKMSAVQYGQCWVFSGVLTTVLRALGIPARSVTNFQSAHDTEFNMTIDKFVDEDGEESDLVDSGDSIWNFHVWNEGYFRRPDLPKGYDGWQAVDATPQEESSGIFQCGPAPVKAIKNGEIFIGSDTNFLFSEVNADRLTWKVNSVGEVTGLLKRESRHVGRAISTKAVGSDEREDLTDQYKFPEGSKEERAAFDRAYAHGRRAEYHDKFNAIQNEGDITIDIKPVGEVINGKTATVGVQVKNTTKVDKTAIISTVMHTILHNDTRKAFLKRVKVEKQIKAGQTDNQKIELPFADYGRHLTDNSVIRVTTTVRVKDTDNLYVDTYDVQVESPDCVNIECDDKITYHAYNVIKLTIKNPLPITLTNAKFTVEGSGVSTGKELKITEPVEPNGTCTGEVEIRPYRVGNTTLFVDFDSTEFLNIKAHKSVRVVK